MYVGLIIVTIHGDLKQYTIEKLMIKETIRCLQKFQHVCYSNSGDF